MLRLLTLKERPKDATRWITRCLAERVRLGQSAISRIWRAFSLQPHRSETFQLSSDRLFIEDVHDIVDLHLNPPDRTVLLTVDEKSQIHAVDRSTPLLPIPSNQIEGRTQHYVRHGTTSLCAGPNTRTGVLDKCHWRHCSIDLKQFLDTIDRSTPHELPVHLLLDDYATHKTELSRRWLARRPHFHRHFTRTSASSLDQIERWYSALTERLIRRRIHPSTRAPEDAIYAYVDRTSNRPTSFIWTEIAHQIPDTLARSCNHTSDPGHHVSIRRKGINDTLMTARRYTSPSIIVRTQTEGEM